MDLTEMGQRFAARPGPDPGFLIYFGLLGSGENLAKRQCFCNPIGTRSLRMKMLRYFICDPQINKIRLRIERWRNWPAILEIVIVNPERNAD